jgi:flagellar assembly protein FliH
LADAGGMSWLFRNKIIKNFTAVAYSMPTLEGYPLPGTEKVLAKMSDPEAIEREAFEKGFASGEKTGFEVGERKATILVEQLEILFKEIYSLKEKLLSELESQLVLLSIGVARRILKKELESSPEIVEKMVKEAVKEISPIGPITIQLNPTLYDRLTRKKREFQEIFPDLIFEMNSNASEGGAVVSNPFQEIQTDLDFQLSNVIEELRSRIENV